MPDCTTIIEPGVRSIYCEEHRVPVFDLKKGRPRCHFGKPHQETSRRSA